MTERDRERGKGNRHVPVSTKETVTDEKKDGIILQCMRTHIHTTPRWISPSHRVSFSRTVMSIGIKMKIFATQIGFALMKVISLSKKSTLIHEMRIDSDCSAANFFFFFFFSFLSCRTAALPDDTYSISKYSLACKQTNYV